MALMQLVIWWMCASRATSAACTHAQTATHKRITPSAAAQQSSWPATRSACSMPRGRLLHTAITACLADWLYCVLRSLQGCCKRHVTHIVLRGFASCPQQLSSSACCVRNQPVVVRASCYHNPHKQLQGCLLTLSCAMLACMISRLRWSATSSPPEGMAGFQMMLFLLFFSISPTPSSTLVMS